MNFKRLFLPLLVVPFLFFSTMGKAATGDFWLSIANNNVSPGQSFDVKVEIDSGSDNIGAFDFYLDFSVGDLQVETGVGDGGISKGGDASSYTIMANPDDLANGRFRVAGICAQNCAAGTGEHVITVHMSALGSFAGQTTGLALSINDLVDDFGNDIPMATVTGLTINNDSFQAPVCGDSDCNGDESCSTCPADCGVCQGDATPPVISNINSSVTTNSATITWATDEASDTQVEYGLTTSYGIATDLDSSMTTSHSATISNLSDNTTYYYRVKSKDEAVNTAISTNQSFTTNQASTQDSTAPAAISDLSTSFVNHTSITLDWTAPGDDGSTGIPASYDIRYSTSEITAANWSSATELNGEPTPKQAGTNEFYTVVNLDPGTTYYFAIKTSDEIPNESGISNVTSNTTHSESVPVCSSFTYSSWTGCSGGTKTRNVLSSSPSGCTGGNPYTSQSCSSGGSGGGGGGSSRGSSAGGNYNDVMAPKKPAMFKAVATDDQVSLSWNNPLDSDFVRVKVLRTIKSSDNDPCPTSHDDPNSDFIYEGTAEQYTDVGLDNSKNYCYAIFAYDKKPNYSSALTITTKDNNGGTKPIIDNPIVEIYKNIRLRIKERNMYQRLKGKILLKVEDDGRAFYIHPQKEEGFYLGRPRDAFRVMREQGVGITTGDLSKIPMGYKALSGDDTDGDGLPDTLEEAIGTDMNKQDTDGDGHKDKDEVLAGYNPNGPGKASTDSSFTNKHQGKIFLQVEGKGEAWYISDNKRYYLGRPKDAFTLMRELSLGISNTDFSSFGEEEESD